MGFFYEDATDEEEEELDEIDGLELYYIGLSSCHGCLR